MNEQKVRNGTFDVNDYMRVADTRTKWAKFRDGIYNPSEGTYCGHPPKKWGITLLFYTCFFAGLAVLFAICMKGLLATLSLQKPRWTLDESLIGTTPGLGFRPISSDITERSLIWYSASNKTQIKKWTGLLDKFLEKYLDLSLLPNGGRNQQICDNEPPKEGNVCAVEINKWGDCSPQFQYGYNNSAPCVFIKLNKIYDWVPDYYNDINDLPEDMPDDLVSYIKHDVKEKHRNTVWVSCKGENPHDREAIGKLRYYPENHGFPGYYFPYKNIPGYLSPVVAVQFLRPKRNRIINVECRAWAKNMKYGSEKGVKVGSTHFELMVDD